MTNNRHPRDLDPVAQSDPNLGFIIDFHDPEPKVNNVAEYDPVDFQIKPAPNGYQIDVVWTDEEGNRRSRAEFVTLEDPRVTD